MIPSISCNSCLNCNVMLEYCLPSPTHITWVTLLKAKNRDCRELYENYTMRIMICDQLHLHQEYIMRVEEIIISRAVDEGICGYMPYTHLLRSCNDSNGGIPAYTHILMGLLTHRICTLLLTNIALIISYILWSSRIVKNMCEFLLIYILDIWSVRV